MTASDVLIQWCEEQGWSAWVVKTPSYGDTDMVAVRPKRPVDFDNLAFNIKLVVYEDSKVRFGSSVEIDGKFYGLNMVDPLFFDKLKWMLVSAFKVHGL